MDFRQLITVAMACGMIAMWIGYSVALENLREENRALRKEMLDLRMEIIRDRLANALETMIRKDTTEQTHDREV